MSNCCLAHWLPKFELFVGGIQVVHQNMLLVFMGNLKKRNGLILMETVAGMYETVKKEYDSYSDKFYYSYDWDDEKRHYFQLAMSFFLNKNNIITEFHVGTDW